MTGKSFLTIIVILIITASAFAQETPNAAVTKVVEIDTRVFQDREKGIPEVVAAQEKLDAEFKPQKDDLTALAEKIQKIEAEFRQMRSIYAPRGITPKMIDAKIKEHEREIGNYRLKEKETKNLYEQRKAEIFAPVYQKVGDAIKQFAKENSYFVIDRTTLNSGVVLGEFDDITEDFIKYYNEIYTKLKTQ